MGWIRAVQTRKGFQSCRTFPPVTKVTEVIPNLIHSLFNCKSLANKCLGTSRLIFGQMFTVMAPHLLSIDLILK
jgi:hypothetical protein